MPQEDKPSKLRVASSSLAAPTKNLSESAIARVGDSTLPPITAASVRNIGTELDRTSYRARRRAETTSACLAPAVVAKIASALETTGADPAFIHAFRKTGRLVTEDNADLLSAEDLSEWDAAVLGYEIGQHKVCYP